MLSGKCAGLAPTPRGAPVRRPRSRSNYVATTRAVLGAGGLGCAPESAGKVCAFALPTRPEATAPTPAPPRPSSPQQIGSCTKGGQAQPSCCFKDLWWLRFLHGSWKARVTRLARSAEPLGISPGGTKRASEAYHQALRWAPAGAASGPARRSEGLLGGAEGMPWAGERLVPPG